jgi:hypothetical protein
MIKPVVPEKGVSYDLIPPSDVACSGVKGSASAREKHTGVQGLEEEGASSDDDDPDD